MDASLTEAPAPAPKVTGPDRELGYRLGAVMLRCLSGDGGSLVRTLDESGLSFAQMKAVMALRGVQDEPLTLKLLAARLGGLSLASTSRAIDGLVKRGLVLRAEDEEDRRMRRLTLTRDGQRLSDRILSARLEGLSRFAASLDGTERAKLEDALELLLQRDDVAEVYRQYRRAARR